METYHKEDIYDEKISPLMKQILEVCKEHEIPMLASFAYENDEENGVGCCTSHLFFDNRNHQEFADACRHIKYGGNHSFSMMIQSS